MPRLEVKASQVNGRKCPINKRQDLTVRGYVSGPQFRCSGCEGRCLLSVFTMEGTDWKPRVVVKTLVIPRSSQTGRKANVDSNVYPRGRAIQPR